MIVRITILDIKYVNFKEDAFMTSNCLCGLFDNNNSCWIWIIILALLVIHCCCC